jgi:amylosucrase
LLLKAEAIVHWPQNPARADDNRWMHRPPLDGGKAARRADPSSLESRVSVAFRAPINARRALLSLRSGGVTQILPTENPPWSFAWLTGR